MKPNILATASCGLCRRSFLLSSGLKTSATILPSRNMSFSAPVTEAVKNSPHVDSLLTDTAVQNTFQNSVEVFGVGAFKYWLPSGLLQDGLIHLTDNFGWSWPSVLLLCAATTRVVLFPITVQLHKLAVRRGNIAPERMKIEKQVYAEAEQAMNSGASLNHVMKIIQSIRMKQLQLETARGCGPFQMMKYPMLQLPVILTMFLGIRDLAERHYIGLSSSSFLWIPSLSGSDPFFILSYLNITTVYLTLKFGVDSAPIPFLNSRKADLFFLALLPLGGYFMNTYFPSALVLYWFFSNCLGVVVIKLMRFKSIRQMLRIPKKVNHGDDFNEFANTMKRGNEMRQKLHQYVLQQEKMKYTRK